MINIKKVIRSFKVAGEGLIYLIKTEQNFRIEGIVTLIVIALIIYIQPTVIETAILTIATASVLIMETINTVLERLLDILTKRKNKNFKVLKDIMATAVLLDAIAAIIIGVVIFGQYF